MVGVKRLILGSASMKQAVLVTGGAGYVGSHACKALSQAGYLPVVFDDLRLGNRWAVKWGPFVEASLRDLDALTHTMTEHNIAAVMHFAAYSDVGESMLSPSRYFSNNVAMSQNVLDAMVTCGVSQFVISSTCAVYGQPDQVPIREDAAIAPINPYGASKVMLENMAHWYGRAHGIETTALRYFNAAGADKDGEIGEYHVPETHLIPIVVEAALGIRPFIQVNGTDYDTPDGTAIRDYIHVSDLATAHVAALEHRRKESGLTAYNLGTGRGVSIGEVIAAVGEAAGKAPTVRHGPRRAGDAAVLVADNELVRQALQWQPHQSDIKTIAETAVHWHRDRLPGLAS
mgnify:CR=1 FL=1